MFGVLDGRGWAAVVSIVPIIIVTICAVLVALAALVARAPETRQHCLNILKYLTQYIGVLESKR